MVVPSWVTSQSSAIPAYKLRLSVSPCSGTAVSRLRSEGQKLSQTLFVVSCCHQAEGLSNSKAECSARTANSKYFSAMITAILISEVEIISILTPSDAKDSNIRLATPAWERMPTRSEERRVGKE